MNNNTKRLLWTRRIPAILSVFLFLAACGGGGGGSDGSTVPPPAPESSASSDTAAPEAPVSNLTEQLERLDGLAFDEFVDASFLMLLERDPEAAVAAGVADVPRQLTRISAAYADETIDLVDGIVDRLEGLSPETPDDQTIAGIYRFYLEDLVQAHRFRHFSYPASYFITSVPSQTLFFFTDIQPLNSVADAEDYVVRLGEVGPKIRDLVDNLDDAQDAGVIMPRFLLEFSVGRHNAVADAPTDEHPYFIRLEADTQELPFAAGERDELLADARSIVTEQIVPAYRALVNKLNTQQASAPEAVGVGQLPGGADYYNYALLHHTTTELSADVIHETGLTELERIHAEMNTRFAELGFDTSDAVAANLARLESLSGEVPASEVVDEYESILEVAYERLPEAFNLLPAAELVVIGGQRGGFYVRPSPDGTRPGAFYAGNVRPEPAYLMKSLAYHEGVPGHHLQLALAQEQSRTLFQQNVVFTGFAEGWALYAERLAFELGWYDDDTLGDLGRLQYEAFRAARLVVDTGIHARGWSFEQAVTFFMENTGFSRSASEGQIARYSLWPGQATAYMIGMLEMLELRSARAAEADFDLRQFHDELLLRGAVPLTMLHD